VAGGTDIVKRTLASFIPPSMHTTMILDLLAYDAFPALAALEAGTSGKKKLNKHLCLFNGFFGWFPSLL